MNAERTRKFAAEAAREADRADAHACRSGWKALWAGAAIANDWTMPEWGFGWLEVQCRRCETRASLPLGTMNANIDRQSSVVGGRVSGP